MDTLLIEIQSFIKQISPFFRSIRFKLAFLYSGILFLFAGGMILTFNIFLGNSLRKDPQSQYVGVIPFNAAPNVYIFDDFAKLRIDERQRIKEIRLNDLRIVQKMSLIALTPLALLSFIAGYYISGKFLDPITQLKKDIERLDSKDLGVHFDFANEDEVGALVASFNSLSSRLQEAFHSQEQFVQNASHELRTPLTVIQTNLDTVLDNPLATKEEMSIAVKQALIGVQQLSKLVNYLLELTALKDKTFTKVNLGGIIKEQVALAQEAANKTGLTIDYQSKEKLFISGDAQLLSRVVTNLVENAIKYTIIDAPDDNRITISLIKKEGNAVFSVTNHGQIIPKKKLVKVFERFYQLDPSRSKKLGGYGLGLSIAKKIVTEHGGKIFATSENGKNTFTVELPTV